MMWVLHSQGTFHSDPVALGRPRMSRFGAYTPKKSRDYQQSMLDALGPVDTPLDGPVKLSITFCHKRPQRLNRKSETVARIPKTTKPDIDNLVKMVMDVLTKVQYGWMTIKWCPSQLKTGIVPKKKNHTPNGESTQ